MERRRRVMAGGNKSPEKNKSSNGTAERPVKSAGAVDSAESAGFSDSSGESADSSLDVAEAVTRIKDSTLKYSIEPDNSLTLAIREQVLNGDSPLVIQDSVMERPSAEEYCYRFDHRDEVYPEDYAKAAAGNGGYESNEDDEDDVEVVTL